MNGFDFDFTFEQFKLCVGNPPYADQWYEAICQVLPEYEITSKLRVAAFLAQTAHESGNYRMIRENLNYRAESLMRTWPKRFPTMEIAKAYERQPEKIANRAYADRMGNGDEASGDGWKFAGKGLIQLTGRSNYERYAQSLEMSLEEAIEHLTTFEGCVQSACWFWETNNLNSLADNGDIVNMSKRINGGVIGLQDRIKHYEHIRHILGD